jgi:hypothetical protein
VSYPLSLPFSVERRGFRPRETDLTPGTQNVKVNHLEAKTMYVESGLFFVLTQDRGDVRGLGRAKEEIRGHYRSGLEMCRGIG